MRKRGDASLTRERRNLKGWRQSENSDEIVDEEGARLEGMFSRGLWKDER